ncbi:hypothetical protein BUE80_DR013329 [Diplocarpon rosae]|nr:hypothetical protein BUE80_DR013329 [Diplocarpon rosae]
MPIATTVTTTVTSTGCSATKFSATALDLSKASFISPPIFSVQCVDEAIEEVLSQARCPAVRVDKRVELGCEG